jgi:hypothetical protein
LESPAASAPSRSRHAWLAAAAVALATAVVFWPVLGNRFIDLYDDGPYVLQNATVQRGLSVDGLAYVVGVGLEMQGRLQEASAAYEEALRRMPGHALARRRLDEVRARMASPAQDPGGVPR